MSSYRPGHDRTEKQRTTDVLTDEQVDFSSLLLTPILLRGLNDAGFDKPSPIQLKAIPLGRCGLDLIAQAKSGTGKTCVFSVIALENVITDSKCIQVLVLAPTREIAVQVKDVINAIGCYFEGLGCSAFIGGLSVEDDKKALKTCHIAVGTPGRIKYLIENKLLKTESVRMFILDEADKLLDDSFQQQINWIFSSLPENKQMMAFSATYPEYLATHLKKYMREPTFVRLNAANPTLQGIKQFYSFVPFHPLPHKIFQEKVEELVKLLSAVNFNQCLVFSNYQIRARSLSETLCSKGWPATFIAGSQTQEKRLIAMEKLKKFQCRILISTDLTARGIDADNVNLVVNMDVPYNGETYLHRIGRAGRFGTQGAAVTYIARGKEEKDFRAIESSIDITVEPLPEHIPDSILECGPPTTQYQGVETPEVDSVHIGFIKNGNEGEHEGLQNNRVGVVIPGLCNTDDKGCYDAPCSQSQEAVKETEVKHSDNEDAHGEATDGNESTVNTASSSSLGDSASPRVDMIMRNETANAFNTSNSGLPSEFMDDFSEYLDTIGNLTSSSYNSNHAPSQTVNTVGQEIVSLVEETDHVLTNTPGEDFRDHSTSGTGGAQQRIPEQENKGIACIKENGFSSLPSAEEFEKDFEDYLQMTSQVGTVKEQESSTCDFKLTCVQNKSREDITGVEDYNASETTYSDEEDISSGSSESESDTENTDEETLYEEAAAKDGNVILNNNVEKDLLLHDVEVTNVKPQGIDEEGVDGDIQSVEVESRNKDEDTDELDEVEEEKKIQERKYEKDKGVEEIENRRGKRLQSQERPGEHAKEAGLCYHATSHKERTGVRNPNAMSRGRNTKEPVSAASHSLYKQQSSDGHSSNMKGIPNNARHNYEQPQIDSSFSQHGYNDASIGDSSYGAGTAHNSWRQNKSYNANHDGAYNHWERHAANNGDGGVESTYLPHSTTAYSCDYGPHGHNNGLDQYGHEPYYPGYASYYSGHEPFCPGYNYCYPGESLNYLGHEAYCFDNPPYYHAFPSYNQGGLPSYVSSSPYYPGHYPNSSCAQPQSHVNTESTFDQHLPRDRQWSKTWHDAYSKLTNLIQQFAIANMASQ